MKNGCFDRKPFPGLVPMPTYYTINIQGHEVICDAVEMVPFVFAKECQYTKTELGRSDKGCEGCKWRLQ